MVVYVICRAWEVEIWAGEIPITALSRVLLNNDCWQIVAGASCLPVACAVEASPCLGSAFDFGMA